MVIGAVIGAAASIYGANRAKKSNQASIDAMSGIANRPQRTALGSRFSPSGKSYIAPQIQDRRADIFAGFPGYKSILQDSSNQFLGNVADTRSELVGNESAFMNSALNPIRQQGELEIGRLTRDFGRRGIAGSSLANTGISNARSMFGRQLTDATAQVRQQQLAQRLGIDEAALNASTGMIQNLSQLDAGQLNALAQQAQEQLNLLGLTQQQTNAMMVPFGLAMQNNQNYYDSLGRAFGQFGTAIGDIDWGGGGSAPGSVPGSMGPFGYNFGN